MAFYEERARIHLHRPSQLRTSPLSGLSLLQLTGGSHLLVSVPNTAWWNLQEDVQILSLASHRQVV